MELNKRDKAQIKKTRQMIAMIKRGYGPERCKPTDLEEFPEMKKDTKGRCAGCAAWEVIDWLEEHIELIKFRYGTWTITGNKYD